MYHNSNAHINRALGTNEQAPAVARASRVRRFIQKKLTELETALNADDLSKKGWKKPIREMRAQLSRTEFARVESRINWFVSKAHIDRVACFQIAKANNDVATATKEQQNFISLTWYLRKHCANPHPPRWGTWYATVGGRLLKWDLFGSRKYLWNATEKKSNYKGFHVIFKTGGDFQLPEGIDLDPARKMWINNLFTHGAGGQFSISSIIYSGTKEPYKGASLLDKIRRSNVPAHIRCFLTRLEVMGSNKHNLLFDILLTRDCDLIRSINSVIKINGAEVLVNGIGQPGDPNWVEFVYESRHDHGFETVIDGELPERADLRRGFWEDINIVFGKGEDLIDECSGGYSRSVTNGTCRLLELGLYLNEADQFMRIQRKVQESKRGIEHRNRYQQWVTVDYFLEEYTGLDLKINAAEAQWIKDRSGYEKACYLKARIETIRYQRDRCTDHDTYSQYDNLYQDMLRCARYRQGFKGMNPKYIARNLAIMALLNPANKNEQNEDDCLKQEHPEFCARTMLNLNVFWNNLYYSLSPIKRVAVLNNLKVNEIVRLHGLLIQAGVGARELEDFKNITLEKVVRQLWDECNACLAKLEPNAAVNDIEPIKRLMWTLRGNQYQERGHTRAECYEMRLNNFKMEFATHAATVGLEAKGFFARMAWNLKKWLKIILPDHVEFYEKCSGLCKKAEKINVNATSHMRFWGQHGRVINQLTAEHANGNHYRPGGILAGA